jgi:hypothetical protein
MTDAELLDLARRNPDWMDLIRRAPRDLGIALREALDATGEPGRARFFRAELATGERAGERVITGRGSEVDLPRRHVRDDRA